MLLSSVPWWRVGDEILCGRELLHEPEDHEGVCPVCEHWSADHRIVLSTLGILRTKDLLGLPVRDFYAKACCVALNDLLGRGRQVRIEEHGVRGTFLRDLGRGPR